MTTTSSGAGHLTFAGLPPARWFFGLRIWIAMMLALYVAFWLELDGASSAATCVAILALPTRGQALEKAFYRSVATVVGVTVSIVITGLFSQARDLFVVAYAGWLGICVFGASFFDGNKAYCCVLSGYTVAIVAVFQLDSPQNVWSSGVNRGAAIAVGIAAITVVNDLLSAPNVLPNVLRGIGAARHKALDAGRAALSGRSEGDAAALDVFKSVMTLHPQLSALETESSYGPDRARAARSTVVAVVEEVFAARTLARHLHGAPKMAGHADSLGEAGKAEALRARYEAAELRSRARDAVPLLIAGDLAEADRLASTGLSDLAADRRPERAPRLPLFRSGRVAARKGVRVAIGIALSSVPLVYSSWPQTYVAFGFLGVLAALGSTTPSIRGFALGALVSLPFGMLVTGVTQFVVLDGADAFPLLAIAMAPIVIGPCLLMSSPNPKRAGMGFLLLVFMPVFLSPANPQSYNPLSFLVLCILATTGVLMLNLWLMVLPAAGDALLRRLLLRSAADDLRAVADGRLGRLAIGEVTYRAADRIGQLAAVGAEGDPERDAALADAFALAETEGALRRVRHRLERFGEVADGLVPARTGLAALDGLDTAALRRAARVVEVAPGGVRAAAAMLCLVDVLDAHDADLRRLAPGLLP